MRKLTLYLNRIEENSIIIFLQPMLNLFQLTIDISSLDKDSPNGYQWENIIRHYLPNLQIFRLRMEFLFIDEQQISDLLHSFRSPFWLEEHTWFVRCHWTSCHNSSSVYLYTLPYKFTDLKWNASIKWKSTCPNESDYLNYHYVKDLHYENASMTLLPPIHFENLHHLSIELPIHDSIWSDILRLEQITSLNVSIHNIQSQLQEFINRIPHLASLRFFACSIDPSEIFSLDFNSTSIRRVDFRDYGQYFTDEQCITLSCSSLGIQCEILLIPIKHHRILPELISHMFHLRTLIVQCEDDDKLIEWLKYHLPLTCTISRDHICHNDIQIWIC